MGGFGSGRRPENQSVSEYLKVDIRYWKREGLLVNGKQFVQEGFTDNLAFASMRVAVGTENVTLNYQANDIPQQHTILIEHTPGTFGGLRGWLRCPSEGCNRRIAMLYIGEGIGCIHCLKLSYESQREPAFSRRLRRARKIRTKLGADDNLLSAITERPKRMHRKTYQRLVAAHDEFIERSISLT